MYAHSDQLSLVTISASRNTELVRHIASHIQHETNTDNNIVQPSAVEDVS